MRWRRRELNGEAAKAAKEDAAEQLREARRRADAADEAIRRAERFSREVERAMRLRRGSA